MVVYEMNDYIVWLVERYPDIKSMWLFGSRANNAEDEDSDWDILVFADEVYEMMKHDLELHQKSTDNNVDMMVVFNDMSFAQPWLDGSRKKRKKGNLNQWEWKLIDEKTAEYEATKGSGGVLKVISDKRAIRIYPK